MCEHFMPTVLAYAGVGDNTTCHNNPVMDVNWSQVRSGPTSPAVIGCSFAGRQSSNAA